MQLNEKQEEAKNQIEGPLLIIAGAGSGKTATLTARVEYMIKEKQIPASSILMVTFTNKAAKEMRNRISKTLGLEIDKYYFKNKNIPLVGTFHSLGIFILKEVLSSIYKDDVSEQIGLKKDFVIYDENDKISVLKGIIKDGLLLDEKQFPAKQVSFYISNAKNSLISPKAYESLIDSQLKEIVWKAYTKYQEKLKQNNAIDFDDILIKTLSVLNIKQILDIYQERYKYLMVDEYQDTNTSQYEIVKLSASKYNNLAVVGDDFQSIYSWRGADMRNILNFKKDYQKANIIKLEQNYRSTKNILLGANAVILNNKTGMKKELWTENAIGEKITMIEALDDKIEASTIANIIKEKKGAYSDNLILYRTNAQSRQIEEAFMLNQIPYRVIGGLKFYDRKEVKDLLAYLKFIHNPLDVISLKRIINTPPRKIGEKSIEIIDNYRENFGIAHFQIIENIEEVEEIKPAGKIHIKAFSDIIKELQKQSYTLIVADLLKEIIKKIGYIEYITDGLNKEEAQSKKDNIDELINVASEYNGLEARESLGTFLNEVALITDLDTKDSSSKIKNSQKQEVQGREIFSKGAYGIVSDGEQNLSDDEIRSFSEFSKDESNDYVTLMTIHTAKGLEEKRVFLTGLEDGIFPSFKSINENQALEEERRLMYVAMTRAREELYISRAKERFYFGNYVRNPASRFLKEIPEKLIEYYNFFENNNMSGKGFFNSYNFNDDNRTEAKVKIKAISNNNINDFNKGDRVSHHKFGNGIIVSLNGEIAEIAFPQKGIIKMNIKIAPIKKIG